MKTAIVTKSLDPSFPKWACIPLSQFHLTTWHDTKDEAEAKAEEYNQRRQQSELEAACKAGRADYDAQHNQAPKGWNAV